MSFFTPRRFSLPRMTLASGSTDVLYMSVIRIIVGSVLLPMPMQEITGTPASLAASTRPIFAETVSTQSTI